MAIVALGYECTRVERDRCRAEGIDAYIARPVDLGHLCEIVERITRTSLPKWSELEDPFPNGEELPGSRRKSVAARDRIAFQFEVDTVTGAVLGGGHAVADAMSAPSLDAALAASMMEVMLPETSDGPDGPRLPPAAYPPASHELDPPPAAAVGGPAPHTVHDADPVPARQAAVDSRPPLDLVRLDLASMKNPALRNGLLAAYLREARAGLGAMAEAVSAGDAAAVASAARRLSQMSEAVGAVSLGNVFSDLESQGQEGSVAGAVSLVARATTELNRVERLASVLGCEGSAPA